LPESSADTSPDALSAPIHSAGNGHRVPGPGADYVCPFCVVAQGVEDARVASQLGDVFYRADHVIGLIASHWWPRNPGYALVVPRYRRDFFRFLWKRPVPPARRRPFALELRRYFDCGDTLLGPGLEDVSPAATVSPPWVGRRPGGQHG